MGAIRAAVLEEQPFLRDPAFEDELVRLVMAYLRAVAAPPESPATRARDWPACRCAVTPRSASASTTALMITPSAGVMPPSPPPRKPSGWLVDGTSLSAVTNDGKVVGARHGVVHERARQELAVAVVDDALHQRLARALGDAAMGLAVQDQRVHRAADIVDRGVAVDAHHAGLGIDLDLADMPAIGIGADAAVDVGRHRRSRRAARRARTGRRCDRCPSP